MFTKDLVRDCLHALGIYTYGYDALPNSLFVYGDNERLVVFEDYVNVHPDEDLAEFLIFEDIFDLQEWVIEHFK